MTNPIVSTFTGQLSMCSITTLNGSQPLRSGFGHPQPVSAQFTLTAQPGGDGAFTTWAVAVSGLEAVRFPIMSGRTVVDAIKLTPVIPSGVQATGVYYEDNGEIRFSLAVNLTDTNGTVNATNTTIDFDAVGTLSAAAVGASAAGALVDQNLDVTFVASVVAQLSTSFGGLFSVGIGSSSVGLQLAGSFSAGFPLPALAPPADYSTVPNIIGMTVAKATATVTAHNLGLSTSRVGDPDNALWGLVATQSPAAGTILPPGMVIGAGVYGALIRTPGSAPGQ
jgi:hypothetical protein